MAVGDLIVLPKQYEWRGLLLGSGTAFRTTDVSHRSMPSVRSADTDKDSEHGMFPGETTYGTKVIDIALNVLGNFGEDIESKLDQLRRAFQLPRRRYSTVMDQFVWMDPGEPKKYVWGRCLNRGIPSDYEAARGNAACNLQIVAYDPIAYSLIVPTGGLTLPVGVTTNQFTIRNEGNHSDGYEEAIIVIQGPWTNPRIQNVADDGRTIRIDKVLTAADTMTIDLSRFTVDVNGVSDFTLVRNDNQWWSILPGDNVIVATRAAGNTGASGRIDVTWRHTYV